MPSFHISKENDPEIAGVFGLLLKMTTYLNTYQVAKDGVILFLNI
jgi:hypothetical protein